MVPMSDARVIHFRLELGWEMDFFPGFGIIFDILT